jgi:hypothetical protein
MEILLNSRKNVKSINSSITNKIEFNNRIAPMLEYEVHNLLSATDIFDNEREENVIYRIYGKINYLSILNGIKNANLYTEDYFKKNTDSTIPTKSLLNTFEFYILRPHHYEKFIDSNIKYVRYFEVIAIPNDFELLPAAFSTNIFGEQIFAFNCTKDFNVTNYYDSFGFPVTELFLYARYKPQIINYSSRPAKNEELYNTIWKLTDDNFSNISVLTTPSSNSLSIGDVVYGDVIEYGKTEFLIENLIEQTYYIKTPYSPNTNDNVRWKYNPFIPLRLRYFGSEVYTENINSTIYDVKNTIPNYATSIDSSGNYVWRRILPQGYTDPISNEGVDYPFINKRRYLFANIELSVSTDLTANSIMTNLQFAPPTPIDSTPLTELNSFNKPC